MPPARLDHLVYAAPDLEAAVEDLAERLGVRAAPGGRHEGLGTRNALLALSERSYLEVIGPDPEQPEPGRPRPFGIDALKRARLVTWAVKAPDLEARIAAARAAGFDPGAAIPMGRRTPAGLELRWRLTLREPAGGGLVPFLIDWGDTPSPALDAAGGCGLVDLRGEHPEPGGVLRDLAALEVALPVEPGPEPRLVALLDTPAGRRELR